MKQLLVILLLVSCGDDADPGVRALFSPDAEWNSPENFYAFPIPHDARLVDGRPQLTGMPRHDNTALIEPLVELASDADHWPIVPVTYVAFEAPVATAQQADGAQPLSRAYYVDVDPASPERGRQFQVVAHTLEQDVWTPANMVGFTTPPGQLLTPSTTYAFVLRREWGDSEGQPLGVPEDFRELTRGRGALQEMYAPLWATLELVGEDTADVAVATIFTTGDAVGAVAERSETIAAMHDAELVSLVVDPDDGLEHERFCELHGIARLPQFQGGVPPFNADGRIVVVDGIPQVQRNDEVPFAIAIPREPMPDDGYPLVFYAHGTDGLSTQVIDRGPRMELGGPREVGRGPAHVLAGRGLASASMALLLGPQRVDDAPDRAYLNLSNLGAYADTFAQAIFDQRLFIDLMEALVVDAALLEACTGADVPASGARFDLSPGMMMGQSAGAHMSVMTAAVDARIEAIVPTGMGGYWSELLATGSEVGGPPELFQLALGTRATLTPLHPGLNLLQLAWEPAEPLAFAQRVSERPLEGHAPRHVYAVSAQADGFHPEPLYDAMVVAYGLELTGDVLWTEMVDALSLAGLTEQPALPVSDNRDVQGVSRTMVTQQWMGDGRDDPHGVFQQRPEIQRQYACFFRTLVDRGTPTLSTVQPESTPCD